MKQFAPAFAVVLAVAPAAARAATVVVPQSALVADGNYYTNNIGPVAPGLGPNDDGSSPLINLGFSVNFFGTSYNSLYINNNGNLTFLSPLDDYIPTGPTGVSQPVISAWFGDVDTRGARSGLVHYNLDTPGQLVVTWDNVGRYDGRSDLLDSFQLVLRSSTFAVPVGEGTIGFFYRGMPWETTDTSQTAAIGFGDGAGNAIVLQGSNQPGLNSVVANRHIWFNQNLAPVDPGPPGAVPEPATWAMMLLGFGAAGYALRRRRVAMRVAVA